VIEMHAFPIHATNDALRVAFYDAGIEDFDPEEVIGEDDVPFGETIFNDALDHVVRVKESLSRVSDLFETDKLQYTVEAMQGQGAICFQVFYMMEFHDPILVDSIEYRLTMTPRGVIRVEVFDRPEPMFIVRHQDFEEVEE